MVKSNFKKIFKESINSLIEERNRLKIIIINNYKELTYEELERFIQSNYLIEKDIFLLRATQKEFTARRLIQIDSALDNINERTKKIISFYNLK